MLSKTEKVLGYVLFFLGLICMFIAFRSVQDLFNQETYPPQIFQGKSLSFSVSGGAEVPSTEITVNLDSEIIKTVNVFLYSFFMFFVVIIGGRLSSLGIQLVREKRPAQSS